MPRRIAFLLFDGLTPLDMMGPAQILSRLGDVRVELVAADRAPVRTDIGIPLVPTATFEEVGDAFILCVPGGFGTMAAIADEATRNWVKTVGAHAEWVTSVCTGSLILAASGLLAGYRAGCHWASRHQLAWFGAIPDPARIVVDRNRVTGGGVTAGIDFALALAALIEGEEKARLIQLSVEYDPAPPFFSGTPERATPETLAAYHGFVARHMPDRDTRMKALAEHLGFSGSEPRS